MKNKEVEEAINFMLSLSKTYLRPDKTIHKNLDPTFYHTLTYEGDIKLINQFWKYENILRKFKNEQNS